MAWAANSGQPQVVMLKRFLINGYSPNHLDRHEFNQRSNKELAPSGRSNGSKIRAAHATSENGVSPRR
jgi:hypothetical protein